jgi:hypothetical protein
MSYKPMLIMKMSGLSRGALHSRYDGLDFFSAQSRR